MKARGVIWERKLIKLDDKSIDLRAWGVPGSDLRARGVIWERKLNKLADTLNDFGALGVTGSDLGAQIEQIS